MNQDWTPGTTVTRNGVVIERNGVKVGTKEESADDMAMLYFAIGLYRLTNYVLVPLVALLWLSLAANIIQAVTQ